MKVLLADDHEIVRTGLKQLLLTHPSVNEVLEVADGQHALQMIREIEPDLVVLDISMPKLSGMDVLRKVQEEGISTRILILSMYPEKEYAIRALKSGAFGYITKDSVGDELDTAINEVLIGKRYVSKNLQELLCDFTTNQQNLNAHEKLSEREFRVFLLLVDGKSNTNIAEKLFISTKTVSTYKSRILDKMQMASVADLTKYAIKHNLT